jgi:N utilization substance protein B
LSNPDLRKLVHARRKSRRLAMQAIYQWQLTGQHPKDILAQFQEGEEMKSADPDYFRELLYEVVERHAALDGLIEPYMDRKTMAEVDPVERAILRIAVYELERRLDVPYRVAVNEAIELTKKFGAEKAHTFVNGVLDKLAQNLRKAEVSLGR